jgi:predicted site-specific integrase-resolvase
MKEILSSVDAAKLIGVSAKTLAQWRSLGRGPCYVKTSGDRGSHGGRVVYHLKDIEAYVQRQRVTVESAA